jgi:methyltransferase (TIGR00027 family)
LNAAVIEPATTIENVSDTAFWIAHYRGLEAERPDALFRDPLASLLAGERGRQIASGMPGSTMTSWSVVIRTYLIDDYIQKSIAEGIDTIVNLGAGLDTRPYRMDLPSGLEWIEVDFPHVIEFKEERLKGEVPRCRLTRLRADLTNEKDRREVFAAMAPRSKTTLVLTEGVVPYLSVEDAAGLADALAQLNVRYWIVDYFAPEMMRFRQTQIGRKMQNAPLKFWPEDWAGFFASHGWRCKEIRYLSEEGDRLRRQPKLPFLMRAVFAVRYIFASPEQRARFRKYMGYARLERASAA